MEGRGGRWERKYLGDALVLGCHLERFGVYVLAGV
jgi:hypothetical protein